MCGERSNPGHALCTRNVHCLIKVNTKLFEDTENKATLIKKIVLHNVIPKTREIKGCKRKRDGKDLNPLNLAYLIIPH